MSDIKDNLIRFLESVPSDESRDNLIRMVWVLKDDETIKNYNDYLKKYGRQSLVQSEASSQWYIRRTGHAWSGDLLLDRVERIPSGARIEIHNGKILFNLDERLTLLALLLENVGIDNAVKLGNPEDWLDAAGERLGLDIVFDILNKRVNQNPEKN